MNLQEIKELTQVMEEAGLTSLEVEQDGQRVCLKKDLPPVAPVTTISAAAPAAAAPAPSATDTVSTNTEDGVINFNDVTELKSPMVGTVYVAPSPGEKPYVHVGDKVKQGQVLCVIEAMKLMNEYTAPQDGEIVDICIEDGQLVEYGQCLFKIY